MKRFAGYALTLSFLLLATAGVSRAQLAEATNVYILPMSGGMDQYLALHLTRNHVLQVVTDPSKADVVITDHIGDDLQQTLQELIDASSKPTEDQGAAIEFARPNMRPLSRTRGMVFLIDRATGNVLWSDSERPDSSEAKEIDRAAERLADRLRKSRESK